MISENMASKMFVDNQGSISITRNDGLHNCTNQKDVKSNLVKEKVEDEKIYVQYTPSARMAANILKKVLRRRTH